MIDIIDVIEALNEVGDQLESQQEAVEEILVQCETRRTARWEIEKTIRALRTYSDEMRFLPECSLSEGTVAVSLPFNNPLYSFVLYCAGPLLSGNRVVCRPSRLTRLVAGALRPFVSHPILRVEHSGLGGSEFIQWAIQEPAVHTLVFTGSWANVSDIRLNFPAQKKLVYSGSGVNAFAVTENADTRRAAKCAVDSRLINSGQDCLAAERFYVHESVFSEFASALAEELRGVQTGPLSDPDVRVGPLADAQFIDNIEHLLRRSRVVELVSGAKRSSTLMEPIVVEANATEPIVVEEKFGPVFPLTRYAAPLELPGLINGVGYGLAVTIWGENDYAADLTVGHVAHNESILNQESEDAHVPFGGYLKSGFTLQESRMAEGPILYSVETLREKPSDSTWGRAYDVLRSTRGLSINDSYYARSRDSLIPLFNQRGLTSDGRAFLRD